MSTRIASRGLLAGLVLALSTVSGAAYGLSAAEIEVDPTQSSPRGEDFASEYEPESDVGTADDVGTATDPLGNDPDPLFDDEGAFQELDEEIWDPLEGMNRGFFWFNGWVDRLVWKPVTKGYQYAVPEPGRRAVRRFFLNLGSAPIFVNDLLQLRFKDAGITLGRFVLNTTVGMAGFFDAAVEAGWERHHSDFGQTLAMAGVGTGAYLVIPILGPTTTRDGFGFVVDRAFEPLTYIFGFGLLGPSIQLMIGAGNGLTVREEVLRELEALEVSSVDFYAAIRSVYLQSREAEIWANLPPPSAAHAAP